MNGKLWPIFISCLYYTAIISYSSWHDVNLAFVWTCHLKHDNFFFPPFLLLLFFCTNRSQHFLRAHSFVLGKKMEGWMTNLEGGTWSLRRWQPHLSLVRRFRIQPSSPNSQLLASRRERKADSCLQIMTRRNISSHLTFLPLRPNGSADSCHVGVPDESPITFASFSLSAAARHPGNDLSGKKCKARLVKNSTAAETAVRLEAAELKIRVRSYWGYFSKAQ